MDDGWTDDEGGSMMDERGMGGWRMDGWMMEGSRMMGGGMDEGGREGDGWMNEGWLDDGGVLSCCVCRPQARSSRLRWWLCSVRCCIASLTWWLPR